jgi:hypothetical protein
MTTFDSTKSALSKLLEQVSKEFYDKIETADSRKMT